MKKIKQNATPKMGGRDLMRVQEGDRLHRIEKGKKGHNIY